MVERERERGGRLPGSKTGPGQSVSLRPSVRHVTSSHVPAQELLVLLLYTLVKLFLVIGSHLRLHQIHFILNIQNIIAHQVGRILEQIQ